MGYSLYYIWLQPFFMGPINARVVRRSLALCGLQQRVSYSECSSVGLWLRMLWVCIPMPQA